MMIEDSGAVNGVILADGTKVHSSVVLSNATPYKTFMELLPENVLPDDFICAIKHLDYSSDHLVKWEVVSLPREKGAEASAIAEDHQPLIYESEILGLIHRKVCYSLANKGLPGGFHLLFLLVAESDFHKDTGSPVGALVSQDVNRSDDLKQLYPEPSQCTCYVLEDVSLSELGNSLTEFLHIQDDKKLASSSNLVQPADKTDNFNVEKEDKCKDLDQTEPTTVTSEKFFPKCATFACSGKKASLAVSANVEDDINAAVLEKNGHESVNPACPQSISLPFSDLVDPPESCAVCLYDFDGGDEIRRLTNCCHIFHRSCLDRWMDHDHRTCPLCRTLFIPDNLQDVFTARLWAASGISDYYGETPSKLVSAMKGSREKQGMTPPEKLTVRWAPDVYDPPPSISTSTSGKIKKPQPKSESKRYYDYKNGKNKQKGKPSKGSSSKDKKHVRKHGGSSNKYFQTLDNDDRVVDYNEPCGESGCFGVGSPNSYCGSSFLKKSVRELHFSIAEAT
ncbi:unnamed protein product [Camellia sinensis]